MKMHLSVFLAIATLTGLAGCETPPYSGEVRVHDRGYDVRVAFSDPDLRIIRDYYRVDYRGLPPGLAKKGKVPPGHAYRLQRNQGVPPSVNWTYLPASVESRLSRLPEGYVRVVIGTNVAILHTRTRVVVDLIENIVY
ncbi:MAG: hypothetical protein K8F26_02425 [Thiobacillus sp.]|jgi:hypothetical protein|nr:hypothetical protein [Thiobacillus sp.]